MSALVLGPPEDWLAGDPYESRLAAAARLVVEVGQELGRRARSESGFGALESEAKSHFSDRVTEEDRWAETTLREALQARWPEDGFLGEEGSDRYAQPGGGLWVADPIDGTANYLRRRGGWAVSLAWFFEGAVRFGLVYDAVENQLFWASAGRGWGRNGCKGPGFFRAQSPAEGLLDASFGVQRWMARTRGLDLAGWAAAWAGHRAHGSAALALCHLADGRLDLYLSSKLSLWDWAAGALVLQEAGGAFALLDGADPRAFPRTLHPFAAWAVPRLGEVFQGWWNQARTAPAVGPD